MWFLRRAESRTCTVKDNIEKSGTEIRLLISCCLFFLEHPTISMSQETRQATGVVATCHNFLDQSSPDAAKLETPAHKSAMPMRHTNATCSRHNRRQDLETGQNYLMKIIRYHVSCQKVRVWEKFHSKIRGKNDHGRSDSKFKWFIIS